MKTEDKEIIDKLSGTLNRLLVAVEAEGAEEEIKGMISDFKERLDAFLTKHQVIEEDRPAIMSFTKATVYAQFFVDIIDAVLQERTEKDVPYLLSVKTLATVYMDMVMRMSDREERDAYITAMLLQAHTLNRGQVS